MVRGFRFGPRVTWYYDCLCAAYQVSRKYAGEIIERQRLIL
jgi:hypothetical protein